MALFYDFHSPLLLVLKIPFQAQVGVCSFIGISFMFLFSQFTLLMWVLICSPSWQMVLLWKVMMCNLVRVSRGILHSFTNADIIYFFLHTVFHFAKFRQRECTLIFFSPQQQCSIKLSFQCNVCLILLFFHIFSWLSSQFSHVLTTLNTSTTLKKRHIKLNLHEDDNSNLL